MTLEQEAAVKVLTDAERVAAEAKAKADADAKAAAASKTRN